MAKKNISNLSRTMKWAREVHGLTVGKVELPWNPHSRKRIDLYGFIDAIGFSEELGIVALQACGGSDFKAHVEKITIECREKAIGWLKAGGKIWLVGWRKVKAKRGGKKMVYRERFLEITLDTFGESCIFS